MLSAQFSCAGRTTPINSPKSVASLEKVTIGGVPQWLLIRGYDRTNPVLLYVHGGPGATEMPFRDKFSPELEKHFVVVHWDQRGAGKSYSRHVPRETMKLSQFISDAHEVVELLRKRFGVKKIYLVGHSFGSLLGILTAQKYPELFYAYAGIGQVVNTQQNEAISYLFVLDEARKRNDKRAVKKLLKMGIPPYEGSQSAFLTQRLLLKKYGGIYYTNNTGFGRQILQVMASKEYTASDTVKYLKGQYSSIKALWPEVWNYNLFEKVPRIEVPVYFLEGRHDYNTPWILVENYYKALDAPKGKSLIWFDNSAHMLNFEEPEKFAEVMINRVLAETF